MMYKVIVRFCDLKDGNYVYQPGDEYPRAGLQVEAGRLQELASDKNRRKTPLIKEVTERRRKKNADTDMSGATELV